LDREVTMELHLEEREASLLYRVLHNRRDELRLEVRHNKDSETREYLKHKERLINRILDNFPDIDQKAHMKGYIIPE
jgi:hypothetical protein